MTKNKILINKLSARINRFTALSVEFGYITSSGIKIRVNSMNFRVLITQQSTSILTDTICSRT
jgi:hypothetical protein